MAHWGVADGVFKGKLNRPYITIPVDPWWYNNEPFEGFNSRAAQIMTHEIINAISSKLEVEPYNCMPLVAESGITNASEYEASRLTKLTHDCYFEVLADQPLIRGMRELLPAKRLSQRIVNSRVGSVLILEYGSVTHRV